MPSPLSTFDAGARILAEPAPVLFLDTCSVLDIIRVAYRPEIQNVVVSAAEQLRLDATSNPRRLWLVASQLVEREWEKHRDAVEAEFAAHLKRLDEQLADLHVSVLSAFPTPPPSPILYTLLNLPPKLRALGQSLIDSSMILDLDRESVLRASTRLVSGRPPAAKGQQYKDCAIIEHYLDLCQRLRDNGFEQSCVFVSSNTKDYCQGVAKPHPDLQAEFSAVGLRYSTDLMWASALL